VVKSAAPHFPLAVPGVTPSPALAKLLVRFNTLGARLLTAFLPALLTPPPPAAAAANSAAAAHDRALSRLALAAVAASNAGGAAPPAPPPPIGRAADTAAAAAGRAAAARLLAYLLAVVTTGVAVPARAGLASSGGGIRAPASAFAAALAGLELALAHAEPAERGDALGALTAVVESRLPASKRVEVIRFLHRLQCAAPSPARPTSGLLDEPQLIAWLRGLPRAVWELGPRHARVAQMALEVMHAAARVAAPGSPMAACLGELQPQLAPLWAAIAPARSGAAAAPALLVAGPLATMGASAQVRARITPQLLSPCVAGCDCVLSVSCAGAGPGSALPPPLAHRAHPRGAAARCAVLALRPGRGCARRGARLLARRRLRPPRRAAPAHRAAHERGRRAVAGPAPRQERGAGE